MFTSGFQLMKIEQNGEEFVLSEKGNFYLLLADYYIL